MAITTHGVQSPVGLAQLRIFEEEGVDPARVVIGHADSYPVLDHYLAILDARREPAVRLPRSSVRDRGGATSRGWWSTSSSCSSAATAPQLLLSQDVCHNSQLKAHGGFGYTYLQQHFLPTLRTAAVGEGEIEQMTIDNPRRILTIA